MDVFSPCWCSTECPFVYVCDLWWNLLTMFIIIFILLIGINGHVSIAVVEFENNNTSTEKLSVICNTYLHVQHCWRRHISIRFVVCSFSQSKNQNYVINHLDHINFNIWQVHDACYMNMVCIITKQLKQRWFVQSLLCRTFVFYISDH